MPWNRIGTPELDPWESPEPFTEKTHSMENKMSKLYKYNDIRLNELDIEVPAWIEQDITTYTVASISEGGCESGAYMPAVTYHQAAETMSKHGDDVLDFIENQLGEIPPPPKDSSWSGMAVYYLSTAVEAWAYNVEEEILEKLDEIVTNHKLSEFFEGE